MVLSLATVAAAQPSLASLAARELGLIEAQDGSGKALFQSVVKTEADTLRSFFRGIGGTIHIAFEVGTQSAWLYEILKPVVTSITVCDVRKHKKRGNKSDRIDAHKLCTWLRMGELEQVYQGDRNLRKLRDLAHGYLSTVGDSIRVMNRIKALYRSWAIQCGGRDVYYTRTEKRGFLNSQSGKAG